MDEGEERSADTWTDLWAEVTDRLGSSDEARAIVEAASGRSGASWLITLDTPATPRAAERVREMLQRRLNGEPLQYVLGRWAFRELSLRVDNRVLIPRFETEQVVTAAIDALTGIDTPLVVDLGTGSGAIALSLALEVKSARVVATDVSRDALDVASTNLADLPSDVAERVRLVMGSWFDALPSEIKGHVDLIVSNPPYVADDSDDVEAQVKDWEPSLALFGGGDGMDSIRQVVSEAGQWLKPGGKVLVELDPRQAAAAEELARRSGFANVSTGTDLANRRRWLLAH